MNINERAVIDAPIDEVWGFITDVPRVGACLPGTEQVTDLGDGAYGGAMRVKVGAIAVRLEGKVRIVERDEADHVATLAIEAADKRVKGSVNATTRMTLAAVDAGTTELLLDTDAAVIGKLGQFGQAVLQKKTRQILDEFVSNMSLQLQGEAPAQAAAAAAASVNGTPPAPPEPRVLAQPSAGGAPTRRNAPTASTAIGPLVAVTGVVAAAVGAGKSDPAWAILGLALVIWGSSGFPRRSVQ